MVKIFIHTSRFKKQLKRVSPEIHEKFKKVIAKIEMNEFDPSLHNHRLQGDYSDYRSVNITGDWRLVYQEGVIDDSYRLIFVGTHSELYK